MSKQKTKLAYYNKKDFLFTSLSKTQIYALYESHTKNNMNQKKKLKVKKKVSGRWKQHESRSNDINKR